MAVFWHCDMCGKHTHVSPPTEPLFEDAAKTKPKIVHMKQQQHDGSMKAVPVQAQKDLAPRTKIIRLIVGDEAIQRDLCEQCLEQLRPQFNILWGAMERAKLK